MKRRRSRKNVMRPVFRMSYAEAKTYLGETLAALGRQRAAGIISEADALRAWKGAMDHMEAATSQEGIAA